MNQFLKSASERFSKLKKSEYLINPLSEIDAEIIGELSEILKKFNANEAVAILKQYKELKDSEIRDMLLQLNMDLSKIPVKSTKGKSIEAEIEGEDEEKEIENILFQDFHSTCLKKRLILGFNLYVVKDPDGNFYPAILLNQCDEFASKKPMYANFPLIYGDEEERDVDMEMLIELTSPYSAQDTENIN